MTQNIGGWLESLDLGKYAEAFVENEIGFDVLSELSEDDLREIGLPMGARKRLMRAIRGLTGGEAENNKAAVSTASEPARADSVPGTEAAPVPGAERRQLTVMFCDLVGSTELASRFDPEDLGEIIGRFRKACAQVITRYDGYIAKYMGDGILVYFGYPQGLERDAERAARSGLGIVAAIAELNEELRGQEGPELAVRIGIDTGPVVVGEVIGENYSEELSVVGETPNIAARLQGLAQPNQVLLGPLTRELVGRDLDCEDLGTHQLKGIAAPVQAWRVVAERESNLEDMAFAVGVRLVGRGEEIGLLMRSWEQVREGRGQAVLINGEPGIGKSALVEAISAKVREAGFVRVAMRCSPYHTNSALYPVIEHLKRFSGWQPEDKFETRLDKLEEAFRPYELPLDEIMPLFAALLSLPVPEGRYHALQLTPQQQKQQTLDGLVAWTLEAAEKQPFLQVWEDLHWADPTTVEYLGLLLDQAPTASLLLALTYRPDFVPPWPTRSHMTPITLNRLERAQAEAMVRGLAGDNKLPTEVLNHIVDKTDGVPLYVEELTKMLLESDLLRREGESYVLTGPLTGIAIPATLQESLLARLDRLPTVREVAQLGAVLGREFAYETLKALGSIEDEALQDGLGRLVEAELLYQRGRPPRSKYIFKHALVQDAAYQSLLRRTRQHYHKQVAELLEASFPETVENTPELVAHHFTEAGIDERAVEYWRKAGERALATYGHEEALTHFRQALATKEGRPMDAETAALLFGLGRAQLATSERYGFVEAMANLNRAFDFYAETGDVARAVAVAEYSFPNFPGLETAVAQVINRALKLVPTDSQEAGRLLSRYGRVLGMQEGDYEGAQEAFGRTLAIAKREGDATLEMRTLASALYVDFHHRRYQENVEKGLRAIELARRADDLQVEVEARFWTCLARMNMGDLQGATEHVAAALASAEKLRNRFWLAGAFYLNDLVCQLKGDWPAARAFVDRGFAVSSMDFRLLSTRALMDCEIGDFSQGEIYLEQLVEVTRMSPPGSIIEYGFAAMVMPMCARITGIDDRFDVAETAAQSSFSLRFVPPHSAVLARAGLALMAVQRGDSAAAEEQYAALESTQGTMLVGPGINSDRVLGLLARTMGRLDDAMVHFEDALSFCRKAGFGPEYAWSACDYADCLLQRDNSNDREKAKSFLDEGLDISRGLGMRPLMERFLKASQTAKPYDD